MEQALPDQIYAERDPRARWLLLEEAAGLPDPDGRLEAVRLWWHARYAFTDKKRRRVQDKFVWLMASCDGFGRGGFSSERALERLCADVLESPELDAACAASDELYAQMLDASALYVSTLLPGRALVGIPIADRDDKARTRRVGAILLSGVMQPLARYGGRSPRTPTLLRALCAAAAAACPGILPLLSEGIEGVSEESIRALLAAAVADARSG